MQWAVIENVGRCVAEIAKGADIAGTEWHSGAWPAGSAQPKTGDCAGFFAGNFWVASSSYLAGLAALANDGNRWRAEGWIGTGDPNYFELMNTGSRATNNKGVFADDFARNHYTSDALPTTYAAIS